jgi:hypothetical protein
MKHVQRAGQSGCLRLPPQEFTMAEEKPGEKKSEPTSEEKMDAWGKRMDAMCDRMDAFMSKHDKRKDEDEEERKDAKRDDEFPPKKDAKKDEGGEDMEGMSDKRKDGEKEMPFESKDDKRKDAKEEGEGEGDPEGEKKGEPEPMASDDKRKDKKDAKKDGEEEEKKEDDDRRSDAVLRRQVSDLQRQINRMSRQRTDEETDALGEAQTMWSEVAQQHGERISRPLDGEPLDVYNRRNAKRFQKHSDKWGKVDLSTLPRDVLAIAVPEIRADSIAAARRGDPGANAVLREVQHTDRTGRIISEFVGPVSATLAPFRLPVMRVKRINNNPGQYV